MSTHWRATETDRSTGSDDPRHGDDWFAPEGDPTTSGGGDLVLAPLPGLPTRWDALDDEPAPAPRSEHGPVPGSGLAVRNGRQPDPAFAPPFDPAFDRPDPAFDRPDPAFDTAFDAARNGHGLAPRADDRTFDLGFERSFDDGAFAPAVVPGEYPAPLPVVAPAPLTPTPPPRASLIDDVQRVCVRLIGVRDVAVGIAREAIGSSITPQTPNGDPVTAIVSAIRLCLEVQLPDEQRIPYYQHRARLRRDLARRGDRDRAILAVRHLVGVPPSGVAARLNVPESQVREVASAWWPDDSRVDSLALLRGIDSWISSDLGSETGGATGNELAHLDDVGR